MKYASAMKYGGELVAAVDCDYDSFKELIPLCPNCKEPVFLRTGGPRESVKGKAYQIGPHWCHFKGVSAEQVAGCELRVNGYTEQDRAKIAAQARGQRLKLLQRWFWNVAENNDWRGCGGLIHVSIGRLLLDSEAVCVPPELEQNGLQEILSNHGSDPLGSLIPWVLKSHIGKESSAYYMHMEEQDYYSRFLQDPRNAMIAVEVLWFLASKNNFDLLSRLVGCFADTLDAACHCLHEDREFEETCEWKGDALEALILWVFEIPWASEFQRLEAEAKQRKA